jgi:hypothetical protein
LKLSLLKTNKTRDAIKTSGAAIKCDQPRNFGGTGRLGKEGEEGNEGNEFFNCTSASYLSNR